MDNSLFDAAGGASFSRDHPLKEALPPGRTPSHPHPTRLTYPRCPVSLCREVSIAKGDDSLVSIEGSSLRDRQAWQGTA